MTSAGNDHGNDPHHGDRPGAQGGGLVEFATRRRVTIAMCTVTLMLFGVIALGNLKVNLLPDLSYPTLTVRTEYTGAAPTEIETLISEPVEEAVGVVKNLRKLKSVSRTGQSDVVLEFAWGTNMDQASLEVRDKMEALNLPLEAKAPVLLRFNPSTEPIMRLVISAKADAATDADAVRQLTELRRYADEDLKKKLEPVAGVAAVKVGGGLEDEIQVDIDQQKLAQLNLPMDNVIKRLKEENINISGGRLEEGSQRFLVRTVNQFADLEDIRNLLVTTQGSNGSAADAAMQQMFAIAASTGSDAAVAAASAAQSASSSSSSTIANGVPVRLKDVASVRQGYKEREAIIRLGGKEAVELAIYKEGDANTVATAEALRAKLEQIKAQIPGDAQLTTIEDQSRFIEHAISDVKKDAVIGGLLAILIIFLFLRDGWSTFVISLSLPVSIITTFFFMGQMGLSLNVMSLGGLALATGLVVDDSIVVLESIAKARERGLGILQAAIAGTREVSMAVVASTLTTIAVFLPLVFVDGIAGQLFRDQALTVAIAIAISLLVSMTLIPMLSSLKGRPPLAFPEEAAHAAWQPEKRWLKPVASGRRGIGALVRWACFGVAWAIIRVWRGVVAVVGPVMRKASDVAMKPYAGAERGYLKLLPGALHHPGKVLGCAALAFVATMALVPMLGADLIPQLAQDRFEMTAKLPAGTPLKQTDALVRELQLAHAKDDQIASLYGVSGSGTRLDASPTESGENIGKLTVVMAGGGDARTEAAITERLRDSMQQHPGVQVDFARPALFSFSTPLEVELRGQDMATLERAGQALAAMLRNNPHYADVKSTVEEGFPEIQIRFDQERAGALGLTTRQIADVVVKKVRRGHPLQLPRPQDRRAGARAGRRPRQRGEHPPPDRQPGQQPSGHAGCGGRSGRHQRAERDPSRRPDPRGGGLGQPARHRPGRRSARGARHGGKAAAGRRCRHAHRWAGRGTDGIGALADLRVRPGDLPGVPGDGLAVRVAAAPVRHPVHHSAGAGRGDPGPDAHRQADLGGGVHRPDPAGGVGDQERDHPDRQGQPAARSRRAQAGGTGGRRPLAPAPDHHDHPVHAVRLPAAGGGDGRGCRSARADGHHRDRWPAGVHAAHPAGHSGGVRPARPPR